MRWYTHAALGASSAWLLVPLVQPICMQSYAENMVVLMALSVFGGLIPDLDAAQSKIKYFTIAGIRPFVPVSIVIHRAFGHQKAIGTHFGGRDYANSSFIVRSRLDAGGGPVIGLCQPFDR